MERRTKAWRRHHDRRMKRRAFLKFWYENRFHDLDEAVKRSKKLADNLAASNRARYWREKTLAEKKSEASFKEQVEEHERSC